jgi:hypothetical protein
MRKERRSTVRLSGIVTRSLLLGAAALAAGCDGEPDCQPPDIVGTAFTLDDGDATVSGTIDLPDGAPSGRLIELFVSTGGGKFGVLGDSLFDQQRTCGDTIPFRIEKLEPGAYTISSRIQVESGEGKIIYDHIGYYGGTVESPVTDPAQAKVVTVMAKDTLTGIDFGLAKIPETSD